MTVLVFADLPSSKIKWNLDGAKLCRRNKKTADLYFTTFGSEKWSNFLLNSCKEN